MFSGYLIHNANTIRPNLELLRTIKTD
jgi:hypothetical protein